MREVDITSLSNITF